MRIGWARFHSTPAAVALAIAAIGANCSFDSAPKVPSQDLPHASVGGIGGHGASDKENSSVSDGGPGGDAGAGGGDDAGSGGNQAGGGGKGGGGTGGGGTVTSFCKDPAHDGMDCDDGFFCTTGEHCVDRLCKSGKLTSCASMDDQCNAGMCDVSADACAKMPAHDDEACDDGLFCSTGERCRDGDCTDGQARVCPAPDAECGESVCDESAKACTVAIVHEGQACDDGQSCSNGETCHAGVCTAMQCAGHTQCDFACPAECSCPVQCPGAALCTTTCAAGATCTIDGTGADHSAADCANGSTCNMDCSEADKCEATCRTGGTCDIVCATAAKCLFTCEAGSTCSLDCNGTVDCTYFTCAAGAHCLLNCGDNRRCSFNTNNPCPGGALTECDDGVLVCGRDCP